MRENEKRRRKPLTLLEKWEIDNQIIAKNNNRTPEENEQVIKEFMSRIPDKKNDTKKWIQEYQNYHQGGQTMKENEKRRRKPLTLQDKWRLDGEMYESDNNLTEEEIEQNIEKLIKIVNNNIKKRGRTQK